MVTYIIEHNCWHGGEFGSQLACHVSILCQVLAALAASTLQNFLSGQLFASTLKSKCFQLIHLLIIKELTLIQPSVYLNS